MLELIKARRKDFDFYYKLKCEESSIYWSGFAEKPNKAQLLKFWEDIINGHISRRSIYILFVDKIPVGYIQVVEENRGCVLSIGITEKVRKNGFGTKIIQMAINKIGNQCKYYCYIREDNVASIRAFENNGFCYTGISYKQVYAIDRREYQMNEYEKPHANS